MILFYLLSNLLLLLIYFLLSLSLINTATNSPKQWQYYYNNKNNQDCWNPARHSITSTIFCKSFTTPKNANKSKKIINNHFPWSVSQQLYPSLHHIIPVIHSSFASMLFKEIEANKNKIGKRFLFYMGKRKKTNFFFFLLIFNLIKNIIFFYLI